jgi:pilus assembly protein Flp/PilA
MTRLFRRFLFDQRGAAAVEYGLVVGLVAVAIVVVLGTVGLNLKGRLDVVAEAIMQAGS